MNQKVYARDTTVRKIDDDTAQSFVAQNHRQGKASDFIKKVALGLFTKNNELVGVIQFCAPRTSAKRREYSEELLRLAFKKDVRVVGGASKLIKSYIREFNPSDFFTYQDSTGEATDLYEKAGMSFVGQSKNKGFLVKGGLTLDRARFGHKEVFTISEASRRGPDALLQTKLGEVFNPDGTRRTNIDLFKDLGWHIEEVSGDKVFEWVNQNKTHYVYKITSTDSLKYYIGLRTLDIPNASIQDCLDDNYWGSGGKLYQRWKKRHETSLKKEILGRFERKQEAYAKEEELVGDLWETDPLCLNAQKGGMFDYRSPVWGRPTITYKNCPKHGETKHSGDSCAKCTSNTSLSIRVCPKHGETKHRGDTCATCVADSSFSEKECPIHGITTHIGQVCSKCSSSKSMSFKECPTHGLVRHKGDCCTKCKNQSVVTEKECPVHGKAKYQGEVCTKCVTDKQVSVQDCPKHGKTKFRGQTCYKCSIQASVVLKDCPKHGLTLFQKDSCKKCVAQKANTYKECPKHGQTKHQGIVCSKCQAQSKITFKNCLKHGVTKHRGNSCCTCSAQTTAEVKRQKLLDKVTQAGVSKEVLQEKVSGGESLTSIISFVNAATGSKTVSRRSIKTLLGAAGCKRGNSS